MNYFSLQLALIRNSFCNCGKDKVSRWGTHL